MNRNKTISVSEENYNQLRKFGYAGQSLNQAIGKLLAIAEGGGSPIDYQSNLSELGCNIICTKGDRFHR